MLLNHAGHPDQQRWSITRDEQVKNDFLEISLAKEKGERRKGGRGHPVLKQAALRHGQGIAGSNNDVVQNPYIDECEGSFERLRQGLVGPRRLHGAARMVAQGRRQQPRFQELRRRSRADIRKSASTCRGTSRASRSADSGRQGTGRQTPHMVVSRDATAGSF